MKILVTGVAGFIGFHVAGRLMQRGESVLGLDSLNDYYDPKLKRDRLEQLQGKPGFDFVHLDVADRPAMAELFSRERPEIVIHLAAQAGVRYSLENPHAYTEANLVGFTNILEGCRHSKVRHLVYASSSSVYGDNRKIPFSEQDTVDHPVSLYAASKKANELMAHCYSHLYQLPTTGLRFFTVYGPWGRPDMALFLFTKAILEGKAIQVFNEGKMSRDFTYVDDIVEGILRVADHIPQPTPEGDRKLTDPGTSAAPYRVFNIGNGKPVELLAFIEAIEKKLGQKATKEMLPMQPGDVPATFADVSRLGFRPTTSVEVGIGRFIDWYRSYYQV